MSGDNGPTINVGGITGAGNINNIGTNTINGGQSVTNNNAQPPTEHEAVETVCYELAKSVFAPLDVPIVDDDDRIKIEPECHPLTLLDQVTEYTKNPDAVTAEEEQTFGERWNEMLQKGGERAAKALATCGPVAVSVIEAMSSPPFPWNLVAAGLKTAVQQFGK